eukprot:CAMPEP_0203771360 /NCGR_PEP_ID=MMETSP0099_2-20121227/3356_1 /ASSEMBLY_ACC=CAM_ASM_000209 /TAXON_ID=96639 /ORGANISM=" , Strain NY0313808BC1" /LENGTH=143 /DNA_ID=CAMNT_0050668665 /DNA_START=422 /DNA_END=853 /DNA_ORIENTATION=-
MQMESFGMLAMALGGVLVLRTRRERLDAAESAKNAEIVDADGNGGTKPKVVIAYCFRCKWGLRAAYMAQEILNKFESDLDQVALQPSHQGGAYQISIIPEPGVPAVVIFDRKVAGRFPEAKEVKQLIRDLLFPDRALGKCLDK